MKFSVFGQTDTGKKREANEDSLFFDPEQSFALVADGMGGHKGGATASRVAKQSISAHLEDCDKRGRLNASSIVSAVREANTRVFELSAENEELSGMGSTLSLLALSGSAAIVAQVGDSRVYLYRDGTLRQLTTDHSWVQEQVRAKIITEEQARKDPRRHWILRALGQTNEVEVDTFHVKVRADDLFILCSDGLHDMVPDPEIAEIVSRSELLLERLCDDLVHAANEHGGEDNISVVAVRVDEVGATAVKPAAVSGLVLLCLLLSTAVLLRVLPRSDKDSSSSTPGAAGVEIARESPDIEIAPAVTTTEPEGRGVPVPDVPPPDIVEKEAPRAEPSLADMKRLAQDQSQDKSTRVDAYKKAAVMCVAENNLSEASSLLQAAVALDPGLSYSADDTLSFELDETMVASLSEVVLEAKRVAYAGERSASGMEATMGALADDAKTYVATAREMLNRADGLAEAGQLPEALESLSDAEEGLEQALAEYRTDKAAYAEAVESTQAQLSSLEGLEPWNVKLLQSDLNAIAASGKEMIILSDQGEFRSAVERASDIKKKVADVVERAAANEKALRSATDALDSAASLVSAVGTGLPAEYSGVAKDRLARFQRELEDARVMAGEEEFKEAQSTSGRIGEECKKLVGEAFQLLKEKRVSLLDGLPGEVSAGVELGGLEKALAAAEAVDSPPAEAVPELLRLFNVAANELHSLNVAVEDAIEKDAAWRREADGRLGEAETHLARVRERFQKGGGSDRAPKYWLDKCGSGPLSSLHGISGVPASFADKLAQLSDLVRFHSQTPSFRVSEADIREIEDRLKELRRIVADGAVRLQQ